MKSKKLIPSSFSAKTLFNKVLGKNFQTNQVHFYSGGAVASNTGIKACFFGGSSSTAYTIASNFLGLGTQCNIIHRGNLDTDIPWGEIRLFKASNPLQQNTGFVASYEMVNFNIQYLRAFGEVGYRHFTLCKDMTNEWEVENAIKDCDVVFNCIGDNPVLRHMEDFEEANVHVPRMIAKVCARLKNDPVKRLIHFSANGADPDSISKKLRTKWLGEQEVLNYFPEATIIRPTEVLGGWDMHNFIGYFNHCYHSNNNHMMLIDGGRVKKQPVAVNDIYQAVERIIHLEESKGQIYELGGSQVYSLKELLEFYANNVNHRPFFLDMSYDDFMRMYLSPNSNFEKAIHWLLARPDFITRQRIDNVITPKKGIKTFADLEILPIAASQYVGDDANYAYEKVYTTESNYRDVEEIDADDDGH